MRAVVLWCMHQIGEVLGPEHPQTQLLTTGLKGIISKVAWYPFQVVVPNNNLQVVVPQQQQQQDGLPGQTSLVQID